MIEYSDLADRIAKYGRGGKGHRLRMWSIPVCNNDKEWYRVTEMSNA